MKKMVSWFVLAATLLGLVSGAIHGISFHQTVQGMRSVVQGAAGTFVMQKGDLFMLAWPAGENAWAFACLTRAGDPLKNIASYSGGTKVDTLTMAQFLADLETDGWQSVSAKVLPAGISGALSSYVTYLVSIGARSIPDLFLFPVILVPTEVPVVIQ